eukprot:tig00000383_g24703.t1
MPSSSGGPAAAGSGIGGSAGPPAPPLLHPALLEQEMIPVSELALDPKNIIGSGGFGLIYRSVYRGESVAVKCSHGRLARNAEEERTMLAREAAMLRTLAHSNVVRFLGWSCGPQGEVMLCMELAANGSLSDYVKRRGALDLPEVVRIAHGIASGMAYLHARKPQIVHRDLNPRNILVDAEHAPKIADFGISKEIKTRVSGTPDFTPFGDAYSSPEILAGESQISATADVWSFGCILRFLLTGSHPWEGMQPLAIAHKVVTERRKPEVPASCPDLLRDLMKKCLKRSPAKRASFDVLRERLEWLAGPLQAQRRRRLWPRPPAPAPPPFPAPASGSAASTPGATPRACGAGGEGAEDLAFLLPTRRLRLFACTWNLQGRPPPGSLAALLPGRGEQEADLVVVGSEQCHRTISRAMVSGPGAEQWEQRLLAELGPDRYRLVAREALPSCHIALFARRPLAAHVANVQTAKVPTGPGGVGTKGAVAVACSLGCTSLLFVCSYLASGPAPEPRNEMFHRINAALSLAPRPCPAASGGPEGALLRALVPAPSLSSSAPPSSPASASSSRASTPSSLTGAPATYTPARPASYTPARSASFAPPAPPLLSPSDLPTPARPSSSPFLRPLASEPAYSGPRLSPPAASPAVSPGSQLGSAPSGPLYAARSTPPPSAAPHPLSAASRTASAPLLSPPRSSAPSPADGGMEAWRAAAPSVAAGASERFERVVWLGDLNYRLAGVSRAEALALLERPGSLGALLEADQLLAEMRAGRAFPSFHEAPIAFPPNYKLDLEADLYDTGPKQRTPAWTDRVLYAFREAPEGVQQGPGIVPLRYRSVGGVRTSGHRPVTCELEVAFDFCAACRAPGPLSRRPSAASDAPSFAPPSILTRTVVLS